MSNQKNILRYIVEFLVIVTGVTVSFWGEEYRESLQNKEEEFKALENLKIELDDIEIYCEDRKNSYEKDFKILNYLINYSVNSFDSIDNIVQSAPGMAFALNDYREFQPPMNRYNSIINEGTIKFIESDSVKQQLDELHNTLYTYLKALVDDEKIIQQKLSSYLAENYPKIILSESFETSKTTYYNILSKEVNNDQVLKAYLQIKLRKMSIKNYFLTGYIEKLVELRELLENQIQLN